jgi:hypothetical protein
MRYKARGSLLLEHNSLLVLELLAVLSIQIALIAPESLYEVTRKVERLAAFWA